MEEVVSLHRQPYNKFGYLHHRWYLEQCVVPFEKEKKLKLSRDSLSFLIGSVFLKISKHTMIFKSKEEKTSFEREYSLSILFSFQKGKRIKGNKIK